jgi:hypothetical protein
MPYMVKDLSTQGSDRGGRIIRVYSKDETDTAISGGGGGASDFTDLDDTPANYTDQGGKYLAVNSGEDAVEFVDTPEEIASCEVYSHDEDVAVDTNMAPIGSSSKIHGWYLTEVGAAYINNAGTDGSTTINIYRWREGARTLVLSSPLEIESGEWVNFTSSVTENQVNSNVGDVFVVDVVSARTGAKGLIVTLKFTETNV